jgi:hypothetical protein
VTTRKDEAPEVPGEGGEEGSDEIDEEGDEEEEPAPEAVGQVTENERPGNGAQEVERGDHADLR